MIVYHGTSKDSAETIALNGFMIQSEQANGRHFGNGVYLATTKKRAKCYGKQVISVEIDESRLAKMTNWLRAYQEKCKSVHEAGVAEKDVNEFVGEWYKNHFLEQGFTGVIMDSIIGATKEIVVYDLSIVQRVWQ